MEEENQVGRVTTRRHSRQVMEVGGKVFKTWIWGNSGQRMEGGEKVGGA
jgi:hypothetical protein